MKKIEYHCDLCNQKIHDPEKNAFHFGVGQNEWKLVPLRVKLPYFKKEICRECIEVIQATKI